MNHLRRYISVKFPTKVAISLFAFATSPTTYYCLRGSWARPNIGDGSHDFPFQSICNYLYSWCSGLKSNCRVIIGGVKNEEWSDGSETTYVTPTCNFPRNCKPFFPGSHRTATIDLACQITFTS